MVVFGVAALLFQHVQAGRRATADQLAATETELEDARHRVTLLEEQLSTQPTRTRRGAELLAELQRWCAEDDAAIEDVRQLVIDSTRVAYEQQRCPGTEAAFHLVTDAESADDTG